MTKVKMVFSSVLFFVFASLSFCYPALFLLFLCVLLSLVLGQQRPVHEEQLPSASDISDDMTLLADITSLFGFDFRGDVFARIKSKAVNELSVLECALLLQTGISVEKKKMFGRRAKRWVWLNQQHDALQWCSKKVGKKKEEVRFDQITSVKQAEQQVVIEHIRFYQHFDYGHWYRTSLKLESCREAGVLVKALSALTPAHSDISETMGIALPREDAARYSLADDRFDGTPLNIMPSVNSYAVLCRAAYHAQNPGHMVVFSRSVKRFFGMQYVPRQAFPFFLRSPEDIAILKALRHKNVLRYRECLADTERGGHYLVFEYPSRGTLVDCREELRREYGAPVPESVIRELMVQVLSALEYLHALHITHGDIRPATLLRSMDGKVKVNTLGSYTNDFTEVHDLGALTQARLSGSSCEFIAPEQCWLVGDAPKAHVKSSAMDVWAVGAVLYYLVFGSAPFLGRDDLSVQHAICNNSVRIPDRPSISPSLRSLLGSALNQKDPETRINLNDMRRHPWFSDGACKKSSTGQDRAPPDLIVTPAQVASSVGVAVVLQGWRPR